MKNIKTLERLQQLNELIKQEVTGSPKQIATRLQISERAVYNLIEKLKDFEAPVNYCRRRKTYYYKGDFDIQLSITLTILNGNEQTQIYGGSYFFKENMFTARFMQCTNLCLSC